LSPPPRPGVNDFDGARLFKLPGNSVFNHEAGESPVAIKTIVLSLAGVRADELRDVSGNGLWFISSTNAGDLVSVRYNDQSNDTVPLRPGNAMIGIPFDRLLFSNAAIAGATATFVVYYLPDLKENPVTLL
jgi:hypothetical protein